VILVQKNPMCYNWEKGVLYENRYYEANGNGTVQNGRRILKEYMIKGFTMDDERLKQGKTAFGRR